VEGLTLTLLLWRGDEMVTGNSSQHVGVGTASVAPPTPHGHPDFAGLGGAVLLVLATIVGVVMMKGRK
jgi:hypothetical protein